MSDGNGFSNKEILLRLEAKLDHALADLEPRVSSLESFRSYAKGVAAILVMALPLAALFIR